MDIRKLFSGGKPVFSFEFFLPRMPEDLPSFLRELGIFKALDPDFVTLTYGAAGSARDRAIEAAGLIKKETGLETVSHLTGIAHTKKEIAERLRRLKALGIRHLVALRGDLPAGAGASGKAPPGGEFPHGRDLVEFIAQEGGFQIAVAGYPETHPEAASPEDDIRRLREKVVAGADWVITQLFFDNKDYLDFVSRARAAGVACPIVPGLMPVSGFPQLKRFASLCKTRIPEAMNAELARIEHDPEAVVRYGIEWTARQALELLRLGAPGIHFFTLNKSRSTSEILSRLKGSRAF